MFFHIVLIVLDAYNLSNFGRLISILSFLQKQDEQVGNTLSRNKIPHT